MPAKKAPFKKKQRPSRRKLILIVLAVIAAALFMFTSLQANKQQKLEREDWEKFSKLETKMEDLETELTKQGLGEWKIEKGCEKPSIKFYTGESGYCRISLSPQDTDVDITYDNMKKIIATKASIDSEGRNDVAERDYIGFKFDGNKNNCGVYFNKISDEMVQKIEFSCGAGALKMYYPQNNL